MRTKDFADRLAYVAITGYKRKLMGRTRLAMLDFTDIARGNVSRIYDVNDAGMDIVRNSRVWKAHQALLAQGFALDSNSKRHSPTFIRYLATNLVETKNGKPFTRVAWISRKGRVYADMPDDTTASGWRARAISTW